LLRFVKMGEGGEGSGLGREGGVFGIALGYVASTHRFWCKYGVGTHVNEILHVYYILIVRKGVGVVI